ncbi:MAG: hypothetical protein ABID67_01480 [Candidatus Nealsonbacteria bacterium]
MLFFKKIRLLKIKSFWQKLPRNLAENYFFTFLGLSFLSVILGLVIFYQCALMTEDELEITKKEILEFNQTTYQKVLDEWAIRSQKLYEIDGKEYSSPF